MSAVRFDWARSDLNGRFDWPIMGRVCLGARRGPQVECTLSHPQSAMGWDRRGNSDSGNELVSTSDSGNELVSISDNVNELVRISDSGNELVRMSGSGNELVRVGVIHQYKGRLMLGWVE